MFALVLLRDQRDTGSKLLAETSWSFNRKLLIEPLGLKGAELRIYGCNIDLRMFWKTPRHKLFYGRNIKDSSTGISLEGNLKNVNRVRIRWAKITVCVHLFRFCSQKVCFNSAAYFALAVPESSSFVDRKKILNSELSPTRAMSQSGPKGTLIVKYFHDFPFSQ